MSNKKNSKITLKEKLTYYPSAFWVIILAVFIDLMGGYMLAPFFGYFVYTQFSISFTDIGFMFTMFSIGGIFGGLFGGAIADKVGRKPVIIFGLVSSALSSLFMPFLAEIKWFYVLAALSGLLGSVGGPARGALMTDILPPEKRTEGFGIFRIAFNVSAFVGPILGGFIFTATGTYLLLFIFDAVTSIITAIIVFIKIPETKPEAKPKVEGEITQTQNRQSSFKQTMQGYFQVFGDGIFMFYILVLALMSLVCMQLNSTLSVFLLNEYNFPAAWFGYLISLNALIVVIFQALITRLIRKYPPFIMIGLGTLLYSIGFGMYGFVSEVWMFFIAMVIITIGECLVAPHQMSLIGLFSPEDKRGRYMAIGSFSWIVPNLFGVVAAGYVMDTFDSRVLWYIIFGIGLMAVFGFLLLHKLTKKRFGQISYQQEGEKTPPIDYGSASENFAEEVLEITSTSEEPPEVKIKS
ncbi:MAG: MFS transporter [Candidatus Lokiarchaeota archaeon]|nr:MFS transporter [Candidatus Lokiarchaeota archaeon]